MSLTQVLQVVRRGPVTLYLDGAHTRESVALCRDWFVSTQTTPASPGPLRVLVFSCRPDKVRWSSEPSSAVVSRAQAPARLLEPLLESGFDAAVFCGLHHTSSSLTAERHAAHEAPADWSEQRPRLEAIAALWRARAQAGGGVPQSVHMAHSIEQALPLLHNLASIHQRPVSALVTGSLYFVGNALQALMP
jgi:folylpolyglutamate synthase/dihydropteroate synthase